MTTARAYVARTILYSFAKKLFGRDDKHQPTLITPYFSKKPDQNPQYISLFVYFLQGLKDFPTLLFSFPAVPSYFAFQILIIPAGLY